MTGSLAVAVLIYLHVMSLSLRQKYADDYPCSRRLARRVYV